MKWGYDTGKIAGKEWDGYLNVELELEEFQGEEGKRFFLWMSRSWEYETVMIGEKSMFSVAMHVTHYDADFDLEMAYLEEVGKEKYEYIPLEFPEETIKKSRFYQEILFGREALNRYQDLAEAEREQVLEKVAGQNCNKALLY